MFIFLDCTNQITKKCVCIAAIINIAIFFILCRATIVNASELDSGHCGHNSDVTWSLDENGTLIIRGTGEMEDYEYGSAPWNTYKFSERISEVVIENGVTHIGNYAFFGCDTMKRLILPDSLTSIGDYAFCGCDGLISLNLPSGLKKIGLSAFQECSAMKSVHIPDSVWKIGVNAFFRCINLMDVQLPANLTKVEGGIFQECSSMERISIPGSVTSMEGSVFAGCRKLKSIELPEKLTMMGNSLFQDCVSLEEITIPNGVKEIAWWTFSGCRNLKKVTIPDGVEEIGIEAFHDCESLTSITFPKSMKHIREHSFENCRSLNSLVIPKNIHTIGEYAFSECRSIKNLTIPNSITEIYDGAFAGCSGLDQVTMPDSLTYIGEHIFQDCNENLIIHAEIDSVALQYAMDNGYKFHVLQLALSETGILLSKTSYTYTGIAINPKVSVKSSKGKVLKAGSDYDLSYSNNRYIGKGIVIVTGKGNYKGTIKKAFNIVPANTKITRVRKKRRSLIITWKKAACSGYDIQYSTSPKFTKKTRKTKMINKVSANKLTIRKLKKRKRYYIRIRTRTKTTSGVVYGKWSGVKKVRIK